MVVDGSSPIISGLISLFPEVDIEARDLKVNIIINRFIKYNNMI